MTRSDHDKNGRDLIAIIRHVVQEEIAKQPRNVEGTIVPGSWVPADPNANPPTPPTVTVRMGRASGVQADGVSSPIDLISNVPLLPGALGQEYGPRGYEDVILVATPNGYQAILKHDHVTSPGANSGEMHVGTHYSSNGKIDGFLRFLNDAFSTNDGKVSLMGLAGALLSIATAGGLVFVMRDDLKRVWIGASNLDDTQDAVVTQRNLQSAIEDLRASVQAAFNTLAMEVKAGPGVSPPQVADVTTVGSTTVKAAQ